MLILSRKPTESIIIGNGEIIVTVINIQGKIVRLGISAPDDVSIHREEIYKKIKLQKQKTADSNDKGEDKGVGVKNRSVDVAEEEGKDT